MLIVYGYHTIHDKKAGFYSWSIEISELSCRIRQSLNYMFPFFPACIKSMLLATRHNYFTADQLEQSNCLTFHVLTCLNYASFACNGEHTNIATSFHGKVSHFPWECCGNFKVIKQQCREDLWMRNTE